MYSQSNEEKVILDYFKDSNPTFIDIGANDGVTFSNTRALAERGSCGVLVEPSPAAFHLLKQNYKDLEKKGCFYFYQCALGEKNGDVTLHDSGSILRKNDVSLVSTLIPEETNRFKSITQYNEITVKSFRWKTFMNRLSVKDFDFISLDTEGMELTILRQMDLSKTKLICVEHNGKHHDKFKEACAGFSVIYESGENLIFAR